MDRNRTQRKEVRNNVRRKKKRSTKFTLKQVMKARKGSRDIALLFL
jgi:hypothetical protein